MLRRSLALAFLLAVGPTLASEPVQLFDGAGTPLGTLQNPLNVTGGTGGGGTGGSVTNTPAPGSAAEYGNPPPVPTGAPLATVPASTTRAGYWIFEDQSLAALTVVLDDGGGNALSVFTLGGASADGRQGSAMGSVDTGPHLGRIRVFGPAGSFFTLRVQ